MPEVVGAADFLGALFDESCNEDRKIVIWTLPDKRTQFFSSSRYAAEYAMLRSEDADVYFGVGLYRNGIASGRGKAKDVVALPTLWGDVDYGKHTSGKKLPPTKEDALRVVAHCGVSPTAIVHTGHGFHAYWFLKEPLVPDDKMAEIAQAWQRTLAACAKYHGYTVDSVGDVSRVLRVPGTFNRKGEKTIRVTCENLTLTLRYDPCDLEPFFACEAYDKNTDVAISVDAVSVDRNASPQAGRLTASIDNCPKFKKTWEKKRGSDLSDHSPSGYDLSLASQAVGMGWPDQEIANLIIAFRREHEHDLDKTILRRDYLQNTIARAKRGRATEVAINNIETIANRGESDKGGILENMRKALRLPISRWVQHGEDRALYSIFLDDGKEIVIGRTDAVMNQRVFRGRIYDVTGNMPPMIRGDRWDEVLRGLGIVREFIDNPERSFKGIGEDIVAQYIRNRPLVRGDDWHKALRPRMPFIRTIDVVTRSSPSKGEYLHVNLTELRAYCRRDRDDKWSMDDLTNFLRVCGFMECRVKSSREKISQRYWRRRAE